MNIQQTIESKLKTLQPEHLEVVNESDHHNVPPGSQSHFKVTIVSKQFEGKHLVARHRLVNACLADELSGPIHALALHTMTMNEWFEKSGQSLDSPPCLGGEKT